MALTAITQLPAFIDSLSPAMRALTRRIYRVEQVEGYAIPPPEMSAWVNRHFGDVARIRTQRIVAITNLITCESIRFNPLRAHRPQDDGVAKSVQRDAALEEAIAAYANENDTFATPTHTTTADTFGRITGAHCITAANIAKYDGWHGLVVFNEFHPLHFNATQFHDYLDVALQWLYEARRHTAQACYPFITWNCLWKSGASITHGHLQMILSQGMASGTIERLRRDATAYAAHFGSNLHDDMWHVHQALGLDCWQRDGVCGYASLTPIKEREVVLLAPPPVTAAAVREACASVTSFAHLRAAVAPLWHATYHVVRVLIDTCGVRSFNMGVFLPPLCATTEPWDTLPVMVRVVDRGDPLARTVNFGAMELFAASVITADPCAVARAIRAGQPQQPI